MTETAMRIGIYVRVSSQEQTEGYSLDAQRRAIRLYCEAMGNKYQIVDEFSDEGVSAKTDDIEKRPEFKEAVEAVERGDIDAIAVHKLDRFARNIQLSLATLQRIDYQLICLNPQLDFTTAIGRMQANVLMVLNQFYVENLAEETRKGLMERKERGYWLGHLPFGVTHAEPQNGEHPCKLPPVRDTKIVVTDASGRAWSRYDALCYIFERYADGLTVPRLARELGTIGFPMSHGTIGFILRNRFYLGEIPLKDTKNKNRVLVWRPGVHEPFIDPELFQRAETRRSLNRKGTATIGGPRRAHTLSGLCTCARCGERLHCDKGRKSPRLVCVRRWKRRSCTQPTVIQRKIEEQVLGVVRWVRFTDAQIERALSHLKDSASQDVDAERARLERKRKRLNLLYLNADDFTEQDYQRERAEIDRQLALLQPTPPTLDARAEVARLMRSIPEWYESATPEERQRALSLLFSTIVVNGAYVTDVGFTPEADYFMRGLFASGVWDPSSTETSACPSGD